MHNELNTIKLWGTIIDKLFFEWISYFNEFAKDSNNFSAPAVKYSASPLII